MKKIKYIILSLLILVLCLASGSGVIASAPYKTYTVDRNGELVETQEAYSPLSSINLVYNNISISKAQDMVFDEDDYLYVCDTGNKRILICDPQMNVINGFGEDKLVNPLGIYKLEDKIYIADHDGYIHIYSYNKVNNLVTFEKTFGKPSSWILDVNSEVGYKPNKIAVSKNGYMYVTSSGSTSGVMMIDPDNNFITYFASNTPKYDFWDRVMLFLFEGTKWADRNRKIATSPFNVMISGNGYVYTLTQDETDGGLSDNFKKVNTGGENYFPTTMISDTKFTDCAAGKYGNTYAVSSKGYIYEYDNEGNLLFKFAGEGLNLDVYGLFNSASSIAVASDDTIYVLDDGRNNIQIFKPTTYTNYLHQALSLYNEAKYEEALEIWQEVLRYNSMFDLAHKGVGLAYYMSGRYEEALDEFYIAYDKTDYSEAFWEIRNVYLIDNLSSIITVLFVVAMVVVAIILLNKKYHFMHYVVYPFKKIYEVRIVNQTLYSFRYLKHPADSIYEVKKNKRASILSSSIILLLIFLVYILGMIYNGFIFNSVILEETMLLTEGLKIILPIILFIVSNHLISSLMEGEGRFRDIYTSTISSLTPILIIYPLDIILSNVLTLNEEFIFYLLIVVMLLWSGILLFINIKETHNYTVGQTFVNILVTIFMVVILILILLICYVMVYQVYTFIEDIVKEVIINA